VAGTRQSLALPQMDRCDGTVCPPQTQQILRKAHSDGTGIEKQVRHGFRRPAEIIFHASHGSSQFSTQQHWRWRAAALSRAMTSLDWQEGQ
jgi:hypothetical protein